MIRSDGAGSKDELRTPFVEQRTYRRRRLMDVARLAPLIGALLFLIPLLWPQHDGGSGSGTGDSAGPQGTSMSSAMIYIFTVWVGLIVFSVGFSYAVRRWAVHWTGSRNTTEISDPLSDRAAPPTATIPAARLEEAATDDPMPPQTGGEADRERPS
ncbi:hypothetical protein [Tritonibacter horizontis]|uniref:Uncharacterized protein n=1 Tax=Tritonibacter horizontis TaxID=1768241 RepID=A0A132BV91_9RHOB|nr:hypothetical protein [Tritonibacter horizontis]KUP92308.1 hypothetical protein TRIHO_27960 [Tritonibacter horizontis]